jgi:hypothetical protein
LAEDLRYAAVGHSHRQDAGERWEILKETAYSRQGRGFQPFAKGDTITIPFRKVSEIMPGKRIGKTFRNDRRRKYHHWVATLFYADGERFQRVYLDREKARRFAERQKKSPLVLKARVSQQS